MTTLPNIKISREELVWYYERNTTLMGAEGKIFEGESKKVVRKIFHPPLSKEKDDQEEYYQKMENKHQKLILLHQKKIENDIVPVATISYQDSIIGYDMTTAKFQRISKWDILELRKLKEKLKVFHDEGIIHGDIKHSNILRNQEGDLVLCDLDNMQVEDYPIDYFNYMISCFPEDDKLVDENSDIYLYNLFLLQQMAYPKQDFSEIANEIVYGHFPSIVTQDGKEELYKMQRSFTGYEGKYLDTLIKRKGR